VTRTGSQDAVLADGGRAQTAGAGAGTPDPGTPDPGTSQLFAAAFRHSRNAMALVDVRRQLVDVNAAFVHLLGYDRSALIGQPIRRLVDGGPLLTESEWQAALAEGRHAGEAKLLSALGDPVTVQWASTTEGVTGRELTLVVVLSTSRWGARFRRTTPPAETRDLTGREREVVRLVALGYTGPEIADQLHIAHDTVRTHVRNAMVKVDARSRAHLVAKALGQGLL
jgi:PAS domain S-box-containing protein